MMHKDANGEYYQPCYIGRTEESIQKRFQGHKRDSRLVRGSLTGGDGKLHSKMWAENCIGFQIEEIAVGYSPEELSKLEEKFIKKYDSIKKGWNKITASSTTKERGESVSIFVGGKEKRFESLAQLCRNLQISGTSLNHWIKKKNLDLSSAVQMAIEGKVKNKIMLETQYEVFKKNYESFNAIAKDKKINKHNLAAITIRKRVASGSTIEEALLEPPLRKEKEITIKLSNGEVKKYKNLQVARNELVKQGFDVAPYSTVVSFMNKGYTIEQAFGFSKRPWEIALEKYEKLVVDDGYLFVGEKNAFSDPVVVEHEKKIYTSVKLFSKSYGLDYSNISKKLKSGWTVNEILIKSGHLK